MKEKKFELLAKIKQVLKNLSLVISMKERNMKTRQPKPFSKRQMKQYKREILERVSSELDRKSALIFELERIQVNFSIYRKSRIELTIFVNQELEKLGFDTFKGGE